MSIPVIAIKRTNQSVKNWVININRPYPKVPNFSISPARKILAEVGASTWTLGNQKCKKYTGNFISIPSRKKRAISNLKFISR